MSESEYHEMLNAINNFLKNDELSYLKNIYFYKLLLSPIIRSD